MTNNITKIVMHNTKITCRRKKKKKNASIIYDLKQTVPKFK